MKSDIMRRAANYFRTYRQKKHWRTVVTGLAAVVVFCTTYALILPAITLEKTQIGPVCSLETLGVHTHTDACYDESGAVICGYADFVIHTHDESCYDEDGTLVCALDEIAEHVHTDACYTDTPVELICTLEETEGHTHTDACYDENGVLICETQASEGHVHTDECYRYEKTLSCGQEQAVVHMHDQSCFGEDGSLNCGMLEVFEHVHNDSCFVSADSGAQTLSLEESDELDKRTVPNNPSDIGPKDLPVDYYVCIDGQWTCVGATKTGWYGDYTASNWTDTNRDYITLAQAESILGEYGFSASDGEALNKKVAYQQKSGNTYIYADVNTPATIDGTSIVPLSRNEDHPGYNLYYLPVNTALITNAGLDDLNKDDNGFYTVSVYDTAGTLVSSQVVRSGGSFTYDALDTGVTDWLAVGSSGATQEISGSTITIGNVTDTTTVSPKEQTDGQQINHSVTFKVCIDGEWQEVGSLPYYYSGSVNNETRAYITSNMAAQILGDYGYTASTAPGYQFGYSYNDIYEIYYDQSNFCMDIPGGNIASETKIQLYEANHTDAQTFRIWEAEEGYHYITPVTNSGLCVNNWGANTENYGQILLYTTVAEDKASEWKIVAERDGTVSFWAANKPDSACIDLDKGTLANGTKIHIWDNSSGNRFWRLAQQYRITNDGVSEKTDSGMYKIGLTTETNGDIVCYYLPGETRPAYTNDAESSLNVEGNRFWSITVRDDNHDVYSETELLALRQFVYEGVPSDTFIDITVENGPGVTWSCVGKLGYALAVRGPVEGDGVTHFSFRNVNQPIEIVATELNPSFTVQYYASIPRLAESGSASLSVIDTSAKANNGSVKLPTNSADQTTKELHLNPINRTTDQNRGNATTLYEAATTNELTKLYADGQYEWQASPGLAYFNKLNTSTGYQLARVGVLKAGKNANSTNDNDWDWYEAVNGNISFTNLASEANNTTVLITDRTVIRLCYDTVKTSYTNQASFHDYDITSGMNNDGTWRSGITGINTPDNYVTSRNNERKFNGSYAADAYAFGNANMETGLGLAQWGGNNINACNGISVLLENGQTVYYGNGVYEGCTFGLVKSLDANGNLVWDEWLTHANLFNDGDANGKHSYSGGSLQFTQVGDTYTLSTANSTVGSRTDLEYFFNPSPSSGRTWDIFTNDFWPMDSATNKTDPLMGAYNETYNQCDIQVNGFWDAQNQVGGGHNKVNIPVSDDGKAHNWYFGMNFAVSFTLTEDYTGPLEYLFFGDDDMWVFLDDKLICDIGGVHSAVGEYVDLRDYLPEGSAGQHTLSFFYTERGGSGSTCWMQFTLPSVSSAVTAQDTGSLQISKQIGGVTDSSAFANESFEFTVELLDREDGTPLAGRNYSYTIVDAENPDDVNHETYGAVHSGGTITLRPGWTATINGIPAGTYYTVTELTTAGYSVTVNNASGYITAGTIESGEISTASFVNTPLHELPQTGGSGISLYTMGGALMIAGAGALVLYSKKRRREAT